jgi:hypothetical protein
VDGRLVSGYSSFNRPGRKVGKVTKSLANKRDIIAAQLHAVNGTDLYAGGIFTTAGGSPASRIAKWSGSSWSALGGGLPATATTIIASTTIYSGGNFGIGKYSTDLVAKVNSLSVCENSAGVQLAFVNRSDTLPYYMTYSGGSWSSAAALSASAVYGPIVIGTTSDNSEWVTAWESGGSIFYRKYESAAWGSVTALSSGTNNWLPTIMETTTNALVPVLWTKGSAEPYALESGLVP